MSFLQRLQIAMQRLAEKIQQFMAGRYGNDRLTVFISIVGLVVTFLGNFISFRLLNFIGFTIIAYEFFGAMSRN